MDRCNRLADVNCDRSRWHRWGRWVFLAFMVAGGILLLFALFHKMKRRRQQKYFASYNHNQNYPVGMAHDVESQPQQQYVPPQQFAPPATNDGSTRPDRIYMNEFSAQPKPPPPPAEEAPPAYFTK